MPVKYFTRFLLPALLTWVILCSRAVGQPGFDPARIAELEMKGYTSLPPFPYGAARTAGSSPADNNFDVRYYRCTWNVDPAVRYISGSVISIFKMKVGGSSVVFDCSDTLSVDSVLYHGTAIGYKKNGGDKLELDFPSALATGITDSVGIYYHGVPRRSSGFHPFEQDYHNGVPVLWSLSEPYGAREWWPCKNDLGDKADSIDIILTNPAGYQASANGVLVSDTTTAGLRTTVWHHRYPISSYLVAFAVSNFSVLTDTVMIGSRVMPVIDYAYPEYVNDFNSQRWLTKQALILYSSVFGEYPFAREKYGYTQFGWGGGMEHQTNTFLNYPSNALIGHETGHQWFGDKITCGSWQDIWLNEGFATYCQVVFNQNVDTQYFPVILTNMIRDITAQPGGSVWVSDTTDVNRVFSFRLSYEKGAYLLHMLRWKMGDAVFFKAVNRYLNDPALKYNYARTSDLIRNLEAESGMDLTSFFQKWFYGEGYPNYSCTWTQNNNHWATVKIDQTTSDPSVGFYDMPIQLRFKNATHDTLIRVDNKQNGETFRVNLGFAADTMLLDPSYWLLAKNRTTRKIQVASSIANDLVIYPNPATADITVRLLNPTGTQLNLQLFNMNGQLVYSTSRSLSGQDEMIRIPVTNLPKAAYVLRLSDNQTVLAHKTILRE